MRSIAPNGADSLEFGRHDQAAHHFEGNGYECIGKDVYGGMNR